MNFWQVTPRPAGGRETGATMFRVAKPTQAGYFWNNVVVQTISPMNSVDLNWSQEEK